MPYVVPLGHASRSGRTMIASLLFCIGIDIDSDIDIVIVVVVVVVVFVVVVVVVGRTTV